VRKRTLLLAIALFSVLLLGLHVGMKEQPDPGQISEFSDMILSQRSWPGTVAPPFELDLLDGTKFKLADHVGKKVILLNFFATWCAPCRKEIPELNRYQQELAGKPFLIVYVDAGEETGLVQKFVDELKMQMPVGIDRVRKVGRPYGVEAYPTNVLIGADGRVGMYESGALLNADVSLKPLVDVQVRMIAEGKGISQADYEKAAAGENYRDVLKPERKEEHGLEGRALRIAEQMGCLCGCDNKLLDCSCRTATGMKKKLKEGNFGEKTDRQIAEDLGAEFCMKGM
jgi:thiol-disulfide isomerase/thioredoxin